MTLTQLKTDLQRCATMESLLALAEDALAESFVHARRRVFLMRNGPEMPFNPVIQAFQELQTPLHEAMVIHEDIWRAYCPRADHGHVLVGPLLRGAEMIGVLAVTRHEDQGVFTQAELTRMTQLSLFFSTHLSGWSDEFEDKLSPRETEVARLVKQGKSNEEIAADLVLSVHTVKHHLKSIFNKLWKFLLVISLSAVHGVMVGRLSREQPTEKGRAHVWWLVLILAGVVSLVIIKP